MDEGKTDALVIGHFCLDIIPEFLTGNIQLPRLLAPGKLVDMGRVVLGTGGAASNAGLALHRLGFRVGIMGKIGADIFGDAVIKLLEKTAPQLVGSMIVSPDDGTSYTVVLNPPGVDRVFLHSTGANDTFGVADIPPDAFRGARLIHFGYPPLMRRFQVDGGAELRRLFERAREHGATTSLDMARPDPDGPSGQVDWKELMRNVLPLVDVFLPSVDEILFMLDRRRFDALQKNAPGGNPAAGMTADEIRDVADRLLGMGSAVVGLKLGDQGFYLKTTGDRARLAGMGHAAPGDVDAWLGKELIAGCRRVDVAGTTGAGDCTIAGFLGALLKGLPADAAVTRAVAVGAAGVEARDATSGVPDWETIERRLAAGWPEAASYVAPRDWPRTPAGNRTRP